jgi:hypothetical protein
MRVVLDESPPRLASLTLEGVLEFEPGATRELRAGHVRVNASGALVAGSPTTPFSGRATITLDASNPDESIGGMGTRGLFVEGGKLALHGKAPAVTWTQLGAHSTANAQTLTLARSVDWQVGDTIAVAPTGWYPNRWAPQAEQNAWKFTERSTLAAVAGRTLSLNTALEQPRWGQLQYVTDQGLSLTPGAFTKPHPDAVDVIDERAEVANLTRNIVIQGADDALWREQGFGAQVMVMNRASSVVVDGVEMRRMGQAGRTGRYPMHWHLLSYDPATGAQLGDATGHVIRNSAIWNSQHRCVVIHGTNGVQVINNICHDIRGHAIFLEDAVERRNMIEGNLVLKVRSPEPSKAVTVHERHDNMCAASSAYWLTNPDNTVRNNTAADAQGIGFWLSYPRKPVKEGKLVPIAPNNLPHGPFEFNRAHANGDKGLMLECAMTDDVGNLELLYYEPTIDGSPYNYQNGARVALKGISTIKNRGGGYVNRVINPDYTQWVAADNIGRGFSGAVFLGSTLKHSLITGRTLNNREPYPDSADPQLGVASYHSTLDIAENTFVNLPNRGIQPANDVRGKSSGVFGTDDYYIRPVEKGFWRNPRNKFIQSDAGFRVLPPHLRSTFDPAVHNHNWTLSGAIWDPQGYWAEAGRWWVLDHPFLRMPGCSAVNSVVPTNVANGLTCPGPYVGVSSFFLDRGLPTQTQAYSFLETLSVRRLDSANNELARWRVERGHTSSMLGNMRHFAAVPGGVYEIRFPEFPYGSTARAPQRVTLGLTNLVNPSDTVLLGVHMDTTSVPSTVYVSTHPDYPNFGVNATRLSAAGSRAEVAAGAGNLFWADAANSLVWVKLAPMVSNAWNNVVPGSDDDLYRAFSLRIEK